MMSRQEMISELIDLSLSIGNDEDDYNWDEFSNQELIQICKDNGIM